MIAAIRPKNEEGEALPFPLADYIGTILRTEVAPEKQTRDLSTTLLPFKLIRTAIAQRLV